MFLRFLLLTLANAHSVLQQPGNRIGLNWHSWHPSDGPGFNCPGNPTSILETYQRNQEVNVAWARNNHQGGFVRFSIVPQQLSDNFKAFEKKKSIIQYSCWETTCKGATEWGPDAYFLS